jgi:hypothetical protein
VVFISLLVQPDGTAIPVYILRSPNPYLDFNTWQLIAEMPKWKPATFKGEPVAVLYNLPIRFTLK